jgi:predicted hydrocarbon binding protein
MSASRSAKSSSAESGGLSGVRVKGAAILPRFLYLAEKQPEALEAIVARLPEPFRGQVQQGLFPGVWYPLEHFAALNEAIDSELGQGDGGMFVELGRRSAQQTLSTIYGSFYERGNPMYLFEHAQQVWDQYYSSGRVEVEFRDSPGVRLSILGFAAPSRSVCQTVRGWMERAIEFAGGQSLEVHEVSCAVRGDEACVLEATWSLSQPAASS